MIILLIFIIIWIISPFVLIPLVIHYKKYKTNYYKKFDENTKLRNLIELLVNNDKISSEEKDLYYNIIGIKNKSETTTPSINNNIETPMETVKPVVQNIATDVSSNKNETFKPSINDIPVIDDNNPILNNSYSTINNEVSTKENQKVSTISVILIVGVIFVLLSGIIFTTTTWHTLNNTIRSILIFSASILFFTVGTIADKKLNLEKTGMSFFSIGCFLLPIDIFAIGVFNLFGDWLSWNGQGRYLLGAIAFILLGIASYIGTKRYKSKFYASTSLYSVSASIGLIVKSCLIAVPNSAIFTILIALYLLMLLVIQEKLKNFLISLDDTYSLVWNSFYTINVFLLVGISLVTSHINVLSGLSLILMSIVLICYANQYDSNNMHYLITSLIILTIGLLQVFDIQNLIIASTILLIFVIVIEELSFIKDSVKGFYSNISIVALSFGLIFLMLDNTISVSWGVLSLISVMISIGCATWLYIKHDNRLSVYFQSMYGIFLSINISYMFRVSFEIHMLIISLLMFAIYLMYQYVPKFRNNFTLVMYSVGVGLISVIMLILNSYTIVSILWTVMLLINIFKDDDITSIFSRYIAPLSIYLIFLKIFSSIETITLISFYLMLILSVILSFKNIKNLRGILTGYTLVIAYTYYIYSIFDFDIINTLIMFSLMAFSILKVILYKQQEIHSKKVIYANLTLINLILSMFTLDISFIWIAFTLSLIVFIGYYTIKRLNLDDDILTILKYYSIIILEVSQWYICLTSGHFIISLIVVLMNFIFAYNFRNNILTLFSIINLYYVIDTLLVQEFINIDSNILDIIYNIVFFILSGIVGRFLHREFIIRDKESKKLYIDYFTIFAIFPIIRVFSISMYIYGLNTFLGFILLSIYPLFYYNRILLTNSKQILLSISSVILCFAFWCEPFLDIPELFIVEWNCLPIIALSLILCVIWKGYLKVLEYSPYIGVCIVSTIISIYEISSNNILEITILFGIFILSIVLSKMMNTKKWRILSSILFCIILWIQPIFTIPEILITEWNCLPLIILSIAIGYIWKEYPRIMEYLPFGTTLLVSIILSISAIKSQLLVDAFILLISLIVILIISFMIKRKKWFVFSTVESIVLTLYLTRNFWLSIAWWVYLLVVGLLMISIGATNEYLKMKNENLKDNVKKSTKRLFLDWKW